MIDWYAEQSDKFIGTTAAILTAVAAASSAGASVYGAHKQSSAANDAAAMQSKAAADTLAYQREQQAQAQKQFEQTQHSNYDQWAADEQNQYGMSTAGAQNDRNMALSAGHNNYAQYKARDQRVGTLGELLGMAPRVTPDFEDPAPLVVPELNIPAYQGNAVGTNTPRPLGADGSILLDSTGRTMAGGGVMKPRAGANNAMDPGYINQQLQNVYKSLGTSPTGPGSGPTDIDYMTKAVASKGGWNAQAPGYWPQRIAQEIAQAKANGSYRGTAGSLLGAH